MHESHEVLKKAMVESVKEDGTVLGKPYDTRVTFISDNSESVQYAQSVYVQEEGKVLIETILTRDYEDGYDVWTLKAFYGVEESDDGQ